MLPITPLAGRRLDWLQCATVLFLGLPALLFSAVWVRWYVAIPLTSVLLVSLGLALAPEGENKPDKTPSWHWGTLLASATLILGWNYFSGVGGFAYQNSDWRKHYAILMDLVNTPWPVTYKVFTGGHSFALVYYLAYYLPIAAAAKVFPAHIVVTYGIFVWNIIASCLAVAWLFRLSGGASLLIVASFILFSGLDVAAYYWQRQNPPLTEQIEWWIGFQVWQFSSNSTVLYWVPQHGFGAWLGTSLLLQQYLHRKDSDNTIFFWALCFFWSPFVFVGQSFLVLLDLVYKKFNKAISLQNTVGAGSLLVVLGLYYASRVSTNTPVYFKMQDAESWFSFLLFITLECLIYLPFITWVFGRKTEARYRWLFFIIIANALLAMSFRLGEVNDFCMRVSLPGLFILQVLLFRNFLPFGPKSWRIVPKFLLLAILLVGAQTSFREIYRGIISERRVYSDASLLKDLGGDVLLYLGSADSFYGKHLAAPPAPPLSR